MQNFDSLDIIPTRERVNGRPAKGEYEVDVFAHAPLAYTERPGARRAAKTRHNQRTRHQVREAIRASLR